MKVISIERSLDNRGYESDPLNDDCDDLNFDGNERLISRKQLYCINNDIVFILINVSRVYVKRIECKWNEHIVWCIDRLTTKTVHDITEILKYQNWVLKFCFWSSYDRSTINIT